jgi:hippurate hydrolase
VIPASAELILSVRALKPVIRDLLEQRITELVHAQAASFGARAEIDYKRLYPALINYVAETEFARQVALDWGGERLLNDMGPITASEDFAFMLEQCRGSYLTIGNGPGEGGCLLHNPGYDFNDQCLAIGASYWVKLTESFLADERSPI